MRIAVVSLMMAVFFCGCGDSKDISSKEEQSSQKTPVGSDLKEDSRADSAVAKEGEVEVLHSSDKTLEDRGDSGSELKGEVEAEPSSEGEVDEPSSEGEVEADPSSEGEVEAEPSSEGEVEAQSSSEGEVEAEPSSEGEKSDGDSHNLVVENSDVNSSEGSDLEPKLSESKKEQEGQSSGSWLGSSFKSLAWSSTSFSSLWAVFLMVLVRSESQ